MCLQAVLSEPLGYIPSPPPP
uniref:Uncharacterized protein n=1 Tax=Anguilla anguilla TaxID=7936 RepID=A0A0E9QHK2_ANGAN